MFVGRGVADGDGAEQRRVEPAAVLVGAFDIEVGGEALLGVADKDGVPADAGVEPDIEDVGLFAEFGAGAVRALCSGEENLLGGFRVPGFDAFGFKERDDRAVDGRVIERRVDTRRRRLLF